MNANSLSAKCILIQSSNPTQKRISRHWQKNEQRPNVIVNELAHGQETVDKHNLVRNRAGMGMGMAASQLDWEALAAVEVEVEESTEVEGLLGG